MKFTETFKTALKALSSNKVRAFLTMLGVIIGVFAVVTLISLGRGIQNYITDQFNALGSNLLFVAPGKSDFNDDPAEAFSNNKLEEKHIEIIQRYAPSVTELITPSIRVGQTVRYKNKNYFSTVIGANYQSDKIFDTKLKEGRYFTKAEERAKAKVALIGPLVEKELFPNKEVVQAAAEFVSAVGNGKITVDGHEDYYYDYVLPALKYMKNEMETRGAETEVLEKLDRYMENQAS